MFSDSFFTPIIINGLIDAIMELVLGGAKGTFHVGGSERLTKYDFALRMAEVFGYPTELITPVSIDTFAFNAVRPKDMSISSKKVQSWLQSDMPSIAESLERLRLLRQKGWPKLLAKAIAGPAVSSQSLV